MHDDAQKKMEALNALNVRNNDTDNAPTPVEAHQCFSTKLIAYVMSFLLVWQPVLVSAQVILADTGSQQYRTGNGVPIINIAMPSSKGVSHNKYQQFNVGREGLILNNARNITSTQLAGYTDANPNLQNGSSANLIINEVVGHHRSRLNGYTEVAGQAAGVVVANPYGISCNGCGFINTPRVSLTTGTPTIQNGQLTGLAVNGGDIIIEGAGLNASNISQFDIITRAVKVNADLHAQDLNLILGSNQVDYSSLKATVIHSDSEVDFSLDSSALGGMYTNAIRLVGTEAGVGVRMLGNVATSAGELNLSVDGKISINKMQSAGPITLRSVSGSIELNREVLSNNTIDILAKKTITSKSLTTAANHITLRADKLNQQGSLAAGVRIEEGEYRVNRPGNLNLVIAGDLNNSGNLLSGGNSNIQAKKISNQVAARINSAKSLTLTGDTINNQNNITSTGKLKIVLAGRLSNSGRLETAQSLTITAGSLTNIDGTLTSIGSGNASITTTGILDNTGGTIQANADNLTLKGSQLLNAQGTIHHAGNGTLKLTTTGEDPSGIDNQSGDISSNHALEIFVGNAGNRRDIDNTSGTVSAASISIKADVLTNNGGNIEGDSVDVNLSGNLFNGKNAEQKTGLISALAFAENALKLTVSGWFNNDTGTTQTNADAATITAGRLSNSGKIIHAGKGTLTLKITDGAVKNSKGEITSNGNLVVTAKSLDNNTGTLRTNNGDLNLTLTESLTNTDGTLEADNVLTITAGSLTNNGGTLTSIGSGNAEITTTGILNNTGGTIQANADNLTLKGSQLLNAQGIIHHAGDGTLKLTTTGEEPSGIDNQSGDISSNHALEIVVGNEGNRRDIDNTSGTVSAASISIKADVLTNNGGKIEGDSVDINLSGNLFNGKNAEQKTGLISALAFAVDALKLTVAGWFNNDTGTTQTNADTVTLTAGSLSNSGNIIHAGKGILTLKITDGTVKNSKGEITSNGNLVVNAKSLDNSTGTLRTNNGDLNLTLTESLTNTGGTLEADNILTITAGSLTNNGGTLTSIGSGNTDITTTGILNNNGGTIQTNAENLSLTGSDLTNDNGTIIHRGYGKLTVKAAEISNRGGVIGSLGRFIAKEFDTLYNTLWKGKAAEIQADHLELDGTTIDNTGSRLYATGTNSINLNADSLINDKGTVNSQGNLDLTLEQLTNSGGLLQSKNTLTLNLPAFDFSDGTFNAKQNLTINTAGNITNGAGNKLLTDGNLTIDTDGTITNNGEISSLFDLTLTGTTLNNSASAIISAGDDLTLGFTDTITNRGRLSGAQNLILTAANLNNYATVAAGRNLNTTLTVNLNNHNTLFAGNDAKLYDMARLFRTNNHATFRFSFS